MTKGENQPGFSYDIQIVSARRRHPTATISDIEGITETQGGKKRVSVYYLSDTREGRMRIENELRTQGIMETPDDAKRARALMIIIQKMVAIAQNHGGLPEDFYVLFEKAKRVKFADDRNSLTEAINHI